MTYTVERILLLANLFHVFVQVCVGTPRGSRFFSVLLISFADVLLMNETKDGSRTRQASSLENPRLFLFTLWPQEIPASARSTVSIKRLDEENFFFFFLRNSNVDVLRIDASASQVNVRVN